MAFATVNGFLIDFTGNSSNYFNHALNDGHFRDCGPQTVAVGNGIPVTVRVRQGVTVEIIQVTVQQATISVSQPQSIQNPIRQPAGVGAEVSVGNIQVSSSNQTLTEFNRQGESAGVSFLVPVAGNAEKLVQNATNTLSKEISVQVATNLQLADEVAQAATTGLDDAAMLVQKLKLVSPEVAQQALQKSGVGFTQARAIANTVASNPDEAATALRAIAVNNMAVNKTVTQVLQRAAAAGC